MQRNPLYKNIIFSFFQIVKNEGVLGLYKGIVPPLINNIPNVAMYNKI